MFVFINLMQKSAWTLIVLLGLKFRFNLAVVYYCMLCHLRFHEVLARGSEKSIFDCDILYFLFIECTITFTFLNEYGIWSCLYFFFGSIRYSIFFLSRFLYLTLVNLK